MTVLVRRSVIIDVTRTVVVGSAVLLLAMILRPLLLLLKGACSEEMGAFSIGSTAPLISCTALLDNVAEVVLLLGVGVGVLRTS